MEMDDFSIPLIPSWINPMSMCPTPDGGLLYLAGRPTNVVYIPPKVDGQQPVKMLSMTPKMAIKHIVSDVDWSLTKYFATYDFEDVVFVWDLNLCRVIGAHRGHSQKPGAHNTRYNGKLKNFQRQDELRAGGAICFLSNKSLLSNNENLFIVFDLVSNKYTSFAIDLLYDRDGIAVMKPSPYSSHIVACGSKRGLVTIVDIKKKSIVHKFRGHDLTITSLAWMQMSFNGVQQPLETAAKPPSASICARPKSISPNTAKEMKLRGAPVPIVDVDDAFDIYDYAEIEEFGVIAKPTYAKDVPKHEKVAQNEKFNFVEACHNLRDAILVTEENAISASSDFEKLSVSCFQPSSSVISASVTCEFPKEQREYIAKQIASAMLDTTQSSEESKDPSVESVESKLTVSNGNESIMENSSDSSFVHAMNASTEASNKSTEASTKSSKTSTMSSEASTKTSEVSTKSSEASTKSQTATGERLVTFLASGSKENLIWIWNVNVGKAAHKITLKNACKNAQNHDKQTFVNWINEHTIITNTLSGEINVVYLSTSGTDQIISNLSEQRFSSQPVNIISTCSTALGGEPVMWTKSVYNRLQCSTLSSPSKVLYSFDTLPSGMTVIRECPHDFNKIAVAGTNRRIQILNLSSLTTGTIHLASYCNQVKSKVFYLAWHPKLENLIAFATEEGRVGVYDINSKPNAQQQVVMPFTNKSVYQMSWALVTDGPDAPDTSRYVLLVCSDGKLFYIPETGDMKYMAIPLKTEEKITSTAAGSKYIVLGTQDGHVILYKPYIKGAILNKYVWSTKICTKYISEIAWSPVNSNKLAATSSTEGFKVFNCVADDDIQLVGSFMEMPGVTYVKWSNECEHRLVVTGFDGSVRVFDTETMTCTALYHSVSPMYSALFMPSDENFVMCTGKRETVRIFDRRNRMDNASPKQKLFIERFQYALLVDDTSKLVALEKKNNRRRRYAKQSAEQAQSAQPQHSDGDESDVGIISRSVPDDHELNTSNGTLQVTYSSICNLTTKEFNRDALECLEMLVTDNDEYKNKHNARLFGGRSSVRSLLTAELDNHKLCMPETIAQVLIPQLLNELEAEITTFAREKRLKEVHLARAPLVSYSFWRKCCQWYFKQMVETGAPLMGLPYVTSPQDVTEAIDVLCTTNYFREAWILAQLNHEPKDPVFKTIIDKWLEGLESKGNLDGAAYIAAAVGDHERALAILTKRNNPTDNIRKIMKILQAKIVAAP